MADFLLIALPNPPLDHSDSNTPAAMEIGASTESRLVNIGSTLGGDGWHAEGDAPSGQLLADVSRKIIRPFTSCDLPFQQSINPYRGCALDCVYCCARPTYASLKLSSNLDSVKQIFHQPHAARLLRHELSKPGYLCPPTLLGSDADPYQPAERELLLTRGLLEVLYELRHPITPITKSSLILRDLELLAIMARSGLAQVLIPFGTLDEALAKKLEPQAASPQARLAAIRQLSAAGIPVGVVFSPVIPGFNDRELENILGAAYAAGARSAHYSMLRLPHELLGQFDHWLLWNAPKHVTRIMAILYGRYDCKAERPLVANPIRGFKHYTELLEERFNLACLAFGFSDLPEVNASDFRASPKIVPEDEAEREQGRLF
jgi:DNA repair photolyase